MYQLDLFSKNSEDFLYQEIQKTRSSLDRRCRALFSLISEMQEQIILLKEKREDPVEKK